MNNKEIIIRELNNMDVARLTSEMIKIKSYSFMENQEKEIAEFIYAFFKKEGIDSQKTEIAPGRFNVVAKIPGEGKGKSLMLSGHMDTVPAYDMINAFSGQIAHGNVAGRGACDMKGPLAAMMVAIAAIKRANIKLLGDLYFAGVADEEEQGKGVAYLIKNGPIADATIVGEPSEMKLALGHKGLEWIRVTITGKKVHGGDRENGINAIEMASRFINKIYQEYEPVLESRDYPILGKPTINIGTIQGGDQPSTFPGECIIKLDRRCVPTETIEQVYGELEDIAKSLHEEDPRFTATIEDVFAGETLLPHLPFCTREDAEIVKSVLATDDKIRIASFPAWTDAGFIATNTESQCIVLGPGELGLAHSTSEHIKIDQLKYAAHIYAMTAIDYCK